ncbi:unnamed protein product [Parnassius apollo]|uniref:(apollo) hypothetical protein n=1 Tax=Parnassius apollo TaxID=110799 RepID=A0A8S3X6G7_PARAO|nr:unnamed protein product [Parnassius apollo]
MPQNRCCVPGCVESGNSHSVLHGFPNPENNPELFRSWIYAVGGDILGLDNQYIYKLRRVCHAHFEQKYCCRYNRISNIAVPTINLPGPLVIPKLNVVEHRPLQAKENLLLVTPSSSKDPVYFASEVASQQSIHQNKENVILIVGAYKVIGVRRLTKHVTATKSEEELHRKIRAFKIKLANARIRSINKVVTDKELEGSDDGMVKEALMKKENRSSRSAAGKARKFISVWSRDLSKQS